MWEKKELKKNYDIVIIGAGVHGLAIAYYLAKRGITNIAVLDKNYIGGGNSGRNTQIFRSNYRTPESIKYYNEAFLLWENLSQELDYNLLIDQCGNLALGHTEFAMEGLMLRAQTSRALGLDTRIIDLKEIKDLVPAINIGRNVRHPIEGGLYQPKAGNIRHDAVVWGLSYKCTQMGVEIHPHTEVTSIMLKDKKINGVVTPKCTIKTDTVVNATAGWCSTIAKMVNLKLPLTTIPLQACITEPLKPFMNMVMMSVNLHAYFYQTARGEVVLGAEIDPYASYNHDSTLPTLEDMCKSVLEIMPCLSNVHILRQWTGICDITPDFSPIIGTVPNIEGLILDVGTGTWAFKTAPASGKEIAELIDTGKTPEIIKPFSITRFYENDLIDEKGAAGTAH